MSKRSSRWGYIKMLAWERDRKEHNVCHICGQPIDYTLQPSSCETAYEPDHIIPFAQRPDLELDLQNVAASHRRCNRARGKSDLLGLGQQSRVW